MHVACGVRTDMRTDMRTWHAVRTDTARDAVRKWREEKGHPGAAQKLCAICNVATDSHSS